VAVAAAYPFVLGLSTLVAISRVDGLFAYRNFYGIYAIREGALAELGRTDDVTPIRTVYTGEISTYAARLHDTERVVTGRLPS